MQKLGNLIDKIVTNILFVMVFAMIIFSLYAIVTRLFSITTLWIDPLLRHLVFLSAFLGGVLAVGSDKHIKIDVLSKFIEYRYKTNHKLQAAYQFITLAITLGIVYFLAKAGYEFYLTEKEYGQESFLGLHSSLMTFIIPLGFGLIVLRGFVRCWTLLKGPTHE